MLLTVQNVSKAYGNNQVLDNVSLTLHAEQKLGLVGANGVGKSTLLRIIVGELAADTGRVVLASGADLGYLPQMLHAAADQTIAELIAASQSRLQQLEARLRSLEDQMAQPDGALDDLLEEYGRVSEQFEQRGGYDLGHRTDQICAGLRIDDIPRTRRVATLSGGEKARVGLAALLLQAPDLLLLDEPTNHLDFATLAWLEEYVQGYHGGVLVVSHDRHFLNRTVDSIVEIEEHSRAAKFYSGNYDVYAQVKAQERARWIEEYQNQQEEIWELRRAIKSKARQVAHNRAPRDGDKFLKAFKEGRVQDTIARNVRNAEERLRRIEEDPVPKPPQELTINSDFAPQDLPSHTPLVLSNVRKAYGDTVVLHAVDCALDADSRIVIVGPNGAGKSTLLKILAGIEQPDTGEVTAAPSVVIGHLDQEQETLEEQGTLFEAYRAGRVGDPEEFKADLLRYGLFVYDDLRQPVATLSVGQKRKLQIARLIAQRANLLLLDEPTNHISLDVLEEFERALLAFPGPIVAISHDRRFIQRFAGDEHPAEIWAMHGGAVRRYLGGWREYSAAQQTDSVVSFASEMAT